MSNIGHKAILASAGSGKTFQLAHRYIKLLAEGSTPDRICAMTFTRKAAGEILDSIAEYLRLSASDDKAAAVTANERINMPQMKKEEFLKLLRIFIDDLHRTRVGTLDSFIVGIAKAFPVELGIPMGFQVVDSDSSAARESRRLILDRLLGPMGSKDAGKNFINAFKVATYGSEEKAFGSVLDRFLDQLNAQYRLCPDGSKWGNEELMWPGKGRPLKMGKNVDLNEPADAVENWTREEGSAFHMSIMDIVQALRDYGPASAWDSAFDSTVFSRLIPVFHELKKGAVEIPYGGRDRTYTIPGDVARDLYKLMHNMLAIEFDRMLKRTAGMFSLVSTYEQAYEEITRTMGSFSFTDIQYLLAGETTISRDPASRLYIDYRMDCRLDHWLLDEFQDTSDLQWAVFDNLVSEIVSAVDADSRSFFYVGDVKQAIYRWRGGNHELFLDIKNKYDKAIELEPMQKTYRCSQPVIDTVNKTFADLPKELPESTVKKWKEVWETHETAAPNKEQGYVAIIEPVDFVPANKSDGVRCQLVADLLNELQPVKKGIEAGILVRSNDFGRRLVDELRKLCPGMSFVHEGEAVISDNEIAHTLLGLVKLAAHPGDEFAWQYVQMTPLASVLADRKIGRKNIAPCLLAEMQEGGFQAFINKWGGLLADQVDLKAFGSYCLDRLAVAAAEYDAMGQGSCNGFLDFMDSYTMRDQPSSSAVRVMTVHQSKGLEFDVVILPQLQGSGTSSMEKASRVDMICAGGRSDPDWIIKMPKRLIAENVEVLNEQLLIANAEHSYDSLCTLYVAMTRAKRGLYMISTTNKSGPSSLNPSVFLKQQLSGSQTPETISNIKLSGNDYACLYEAGNKLQIADPVLNYFRLRILRRDKTPGQATAELPEGYAESGDVLRHLEPSKEAAISRNAGSLFQARSTDIMNFGTAIHEMFEQVERPEEADVEKIISEWRPTSEYDEEVTEDAIAQFRNCMTSDEVRSALSPRDTLWREKRFEVVLNNEFVSGAFDRVVIERDKNGKPVSATILDYKSSLAETDEKIDHKVEGYTPQMLTYRDALSVILGIPKEKITLQLLFTKQQIVKEIVMKDES